MDNRVMAAVGGAIRGINSNGKSTIKKEIKKKEI